MLSTSLDDARANYEAARAAERQAPDGLSRFDAGRVRADALCEVFYWQAEEDEGQLRRWEADYAANEHYYRNLTY